MNFKVTPCNSKPLQLTYACEFLKADFLLIMAVFVWLAFLVHVYIAHLQLRIESSKNCNGQYSCSSTLVRCCTPQTNGDHLYTCTCSYLALYIVTVSKILRAITAHYPLSSCKVDDVPASCIGFDLLPPYKHWNSPSTSCVNTTVIFPEPDCLTRIIASVRFDWFHRNLAFSETCWR